MPQGTTNMQPSGEPRRWTSRPEGATWGDFGPQDQVGRLNLLTPEKVRQGIAEVKEGRTFCLSLPLDYPGGSVLSPRRYPPVLRPTVRNGKVNWNYNFADDDPQRRDLVCDDAVVLHTHYSTHWDAFCHVGHLFDVKGDGALEPVYYNGYRAGRDIVGPGRLDDAGSVGTFEAQATSQARALGIDKMAATCVQGRAVLIDLHKHFGSQRTLVGYDELMRVLDADRIVVETGDMVCLHTGFAQMLLEMNKQPDEHLKASCAALDGRDDRLLAWISASGLCTLIADNFAVEALPPEPESPLHGPALACHCLFKPGVHLGELWHLTPLAAWLGSCGRSWFLLTAPPLRLPGASGSPVTPVATV